MKVLGEKIKAMAFQADVISSRVSDVLTEAILDGSLENGQKLIETDLQQMFGISRSPLREAIRDLEKKGLVTIVPRRGAFVRRVTVKDIEDIFPVRANLEALAARIAHARINADDLVEMRATLEKMTAAQQQGNTKHYWRRHADFHEIFIHASGNDVLIETLSRLRLHSLWYRFSYQYYEEDQISHLEVHRRIYRLFEDRTADVAVLEKIVHDHIEGAFEKFVGYLNRREGDAEAVIPLTGPDRGKRGR